MWKQEQLEVAVKDVSFVIDNVPALDAQESLPFYGRLDVSKIGVCGHSAGGALAMRMCFEDNRIMAGISLDGSIRGNESLTTFTTPFLLILAEKSHVHKGAEGLQGLAKYNQLCHKPHMQMSIMTFRGVGHTVFQICHYYCMQQCSLGCYHMLYQSILIRLLRMRVEHSIEQDHI